MAVKRTKTETPPFVTRTYKIKLKPTDRQIKKLLGWFRLMNELYNAAIQERRDAWQLNRVSIGYNEQSKQLTEIKKIRPEFMDINSHALQDVLTRVDLAFKAFYRRAKAGQKPGFPRFKPVSRFTSFTIPNTRYSISGSRIDISRLGSIKTLITHDNRELTGKMKSATVSYEAGSWYVCIVTENEPSQFVLPKTGERVGINIGIKKFAVLSDGTVIDNPQYYEALHKKLAVAQRRVSRRKKGSARRRKAVLALSKIHQKIANCRNDFQHKLTTNIVKQYDVIAVEDLNITSMTEEKWGRGIHDAAWGYFHEKLRYKAESAGKSFVKVKPFKREETTMEYEARKRIAASEILKRGNEQLSAVN